MSVIKDIEDIDKIIRKYVGDMDEMYEKLNSESDLSVLIHLLRKIVSALEELRSKGYTMEDLLEYLKIMHGNLFRFSKRVQEEIEEQFYVNKHIFRENQDMLDLNNKSRLMELMSSASEVAMMLYNTNPDVQFVVMIGTDPQVMDYYYISVMLKRIISAIRKDIMNEGNNNKLRR